MCSGAFASGDRRRDTGTRTRPSLWFADDGTGGYITPAGDFSTLVANMNGTFTRTHKDGVQVHFNSTGLETSIFDRRGNTWLKTVTDQEGGVTSYTYDLAGRLTSVTDPENNTTSYAYDNADRLITRTDPRNEATQYVYDDAGQLTRMTDRNGRPTEYTYDTLGRRTAEKWLDSNNMVIRTIALTYDNADQLLTIGDSDSSYTYTYDASGNVATVDNTGSPLVPQTTLTSTYGEYGQRLTMEDSRGGDLYVEYDYALRPFIMSLSDGVAQATVEFGYDEADRLNWISRDGGSGLDTTLSYDTSDRLTSILHTTNLGQLSFSYGYNSENELTSYTGPEGTLAYTYDETHQLTGASGARTEGYSYDDNGNRTMTGYSTGTNNRLLSDGTFNYTYDDEGNRLTKTEIATGELTEYTWDHRNRLTKVVIKDSLGAVIRQADFTYDVHNNLIIRAIDPDGVGMQPVDKLFTLYDGIHPYIDFDDAGQVEHRYLYGAAVDQILARLDGAGNIEWYLTDNLGSVRQIVDSAGTILNEKTYDSFGNIIAETNPSAGDRFAYTAREWEAAIDLQFSRARWYDPDVGRFISEDPIGFEGSDINLYRYVDNMAVFRTDPSGLEPGWWDELPRIPRSSPPKPKPVGCRFYVAVDDVFGNDMQAKCARACGFSHVDLASTCAGVIRVGFGGGNERAVPKPRQPDANDIVLTQNSTGTLKHGNGKGINCATATYQQIVDCITAAPAPPSDSYNAVYNNCWGDVKKAVKDCCLEGYGTDPLPDRNFPIF